MKLRIVSNNCLSLCMVGAILISLFSSFVYADQTINDRIEIDDDNIGADIAADDLFGYGIETIGDLDGDGVTDLAVVKFEDDSGGVDEGSVLILFMNSNGSVKSTNEITMETTAGNIGASCIAGDGSNRDPFSLEQIAFVGDLDNDGEPTLAIGAEGHDHNVTNSGAIYMVELNTDGTVDNCFRIIPTTASSTTGFAPGNGVYREGGGAFLGWPLIATDLNGDGQNELLAGASNEADTSTDLWPLFLNSTGGVDSHPATPIFGIADIGIDSGDYISDGHTVDDSTKIIVSAQNGAADDSGSIFIVTLTSAGAFSSSTEITGTSLGQGIAGNDNFGRGVTPLGDMDNDGIDDLLVAAFTGDDTNTNSGEAYILFMNSNDSVKSSQKISNIIEIARTAITPFAMGDFFGHGMSLWRENSTDAVIAIGAHQDDTGGSVAGAVHLFSIARNSDSFTSNQSTEPGFSSTLDDLSVSISGSGTTLKTLTLEKLSSNPESENLPNSRVGSFYDIEGTGTLNNITLTIDYTESQIANIDESSLTIYRFTGGEWVALSTTVNTSTNKATATTPGFSTFSLGGTPSTSSSSTSTSGGHGRIGVDTGQSTSKSSDNCNSSILGKGISLQVYKVSYDLGEVTVNARSTCGPIQVYLNTEYGRETVGINLDDPMSVDEDGKLKYQIFTKNIDKSLKSFGILIKDKRDNFTDEIQIIRDSFERLYGQGTGYTSSQKNTLDLLIGETPIIEYEKNEMPSWIKQKLDKVTGHPTRDKYFFESIDYLIDHNIVHFEDWSKSDSLKTMQNYPEWILELINFYLDGDMSDEEFVSTIEYLIEQRIVRVGR